MPISIRSVLAPSLVAILMALTLTACESNDLDLSQPAIVLGGEAVADSTLVENVKAALKRNAQTTLLKLSVSSVDDAIILKGVVGNDQERQSALQVAASVDGVRHVTDNLYILD